MFFLTDEMTGKATAFMGRDGLAGALEELFADVSNDMRVPILLDTFERGGDVSAFEEHLRIKITEI